MLEETHFILSLPLRVSELNVFFNFQVFYIIRLSCPTFESGSSSTTGAYENDNILDYLAMTTHSLGGSDVCDVAMASSNFIMNHSP